MFRRILIICVVLVCSVAAGLAQSGADQGISGSVKDTSASIVPNASIVITNQGTNARRELTANGDGNFAAPSLQPGSYTIEVTASGFKKYHVQNVQLSVGQQLSLPITLSVGDVTETVEVSAEAMQIETTTGEQSSLISGTQVANIQLNGRNFIQLVALAPGVSTVYSSGFNLMGPYGDIAAAQSVNGSRPVDSSYVVDGINDKDEGGPTSNNFVNITPDAIAEFRTVSLGQSAQYGSNAGPTISVAMKSGTREFHGTAYDYIRNDAIQAHSLNSSAKPELRYNNFGWTLGGPVFIPRTYNTGRDKLFAFAGQDFKRAIVNNVVLWTVPTLQNRSGDFSNLPTSSQPKNPATGLPYPGGIISPSQQDANGRALVNLLPKPNFTGAGGNYSYLNPNGTTKDLEYFIKTDYNLSSEDTITFHWAHDRYNFPGGPTVAISWSPVITGVLSSLQWNKVINSTTVNTLSFAWSGNTIQQKNGIHANSALGLSSILRSDNGLAYPTIYGASPDIPTVQIAGYTTLTAAAFQFSNYSRIYTIQDDFSHIIGNHTLRAGIQYYRWRKNQDSIPPLNGTFVFSTSRSGTSGNALADALIGNYQQYTEGSATAQAWPRYTDVEPYIQDDWKASSRLTLNAGLRWTYNQPEYLALFNAADFLPSYFNAGKAPAIDSKTGAITSAPGSYDPYNGLVLPGTGFPDEAKVGNRVPAVNNPALASLFHGLPKGYANTQWGLFAPRAGVAYDLTGHQSIVVRGGFALLYQRILTTYPDGGIIQPPFVNQTQLFNGQVSNPAGVGSSTFPSNIAVAYPQDFRQPHIMNYSLSIEKQFGSSTLVQVGYAGSVSRQLTYLQDLNQLAPGTLQANPGVNVNALRPYKGYGDILSYANGALANYNGFVSQFRRQFKNSGSVQVSYTWAKNLASSQAHNYVPQYQTNIAAEYGPAFFQRPQVLSANYVYTLPFWNRGHEWYKTAFGAWSISGVTMIQAGLPINVTIPNDLAGTGFNAQSAGGTSFLGGANITTFLERPNLVSNPRTGAKGRQFLNPAAFANPIAGTFGNMRPLSIKGPLFDNWDFSAEKKFPLGEKVAFTLRGEAFNFPNHFSYDGIQNVFGQANFGQVVSASDPRTFEFAARITF